MFINKNEARFIHLTMFACILGRPNQANHRTMNEPEVTSARTYVALTHSPLSIQQVTSQVRSPKAGAIVLFAGSPALDLTIWI